MLVVKRTSRIGQSSLERKAYNRELSLGVVVLAVAVVVSALATKEPSIEDITTSFLKTVPEEQRGAYLRAMNRISINDPSIVTQPGRWSSELQRLAKRYAL
jgi:hypothetical protein|tara:strand:+ start:2294 stop:2596 length:303 start_codon:yes stop_codon:yes gene_type:complete